MRPSVIIFCLLWFSVNLEVFAQVSCHEAVTQGLRFQVQADSIQRLIESQVLTLSTAPEAKKNDIKNTIRDHKTLAITLQKKANKWFDQVKTFELPAVTGDSVSIAEFVILPKSPYSMSSPVPVDVPLPDGVVYKIQLGAFRNPSAAKTFKDLTPLSGETLDNGVTKYYAGLFRRFADANDALRKVYEYGFKDAFIVAFYNQKTINIGRARQLEGGY